MYTTINRVSSFDGYELNVKIDSPNSSLIDKIVIFIHGSGPNTYDNRRKIRDMEFNYFDLFAQEFTKRNIAFCRWNTRGCSLGKEPPMYVNIDEEEYMNYLPSTSIKDIECVINYLKKLNQFKKSRIILLGWSEGAKIAPLVALNKNVKIDGLLLAGYANENMRTTLEWQLSGGSSMVNLRKWFDYDKKGYVTKTDFEEDRYKVREGVFCETTFEQLDVNGDGILDELDFEIINRDFKKTLLSAIKNDDDKWLKENYPVYLTSKWWKEHFNLPATKDVLTKLSIPIHIFHGKNDANIPVQDVINIDNAFKTLGKDNLYTHIFENHDHDLNYLYYPLKGVISEGLQTIFKVSTTL